jgi:hypothetical protein
MYPTDGFYDGIPKTDKKLTDGIKHLLRKKGKTCKELRSWMKPLKPENLIIFKSGELILLALLLLSSPAYASEIPKTRAVNAVIGEAEGEGYVGMKAVACAIRNRGTLKGVYGEHAKRVRQHLYSPKTFVIAVRAWEESSHPEQCTFIGGATHWEGTAFPIPYWAKDMILTATIGNQRFYRERSKDEVR